jgi:hypothetical protein
MARCAIIRDGVVTSSHRSKSTRQFLFRTGVICPRRRRAADAGGIRYRHGW